MDSYQEFIAMSRYARWLEQEQRRETWEETVDRYCDFMLAHVEEKTDISKEDMELLRGVFNDT